MGCTMASLISVNVGMPRNIDWHGKTVHTGIWKHPVPGPCMVRRLNIDGDRVGHGGAKITPAGYVALTDGTVAVRVAR
jgi:MOSC domain-containing protein YiiM